MNATHEVATEQQRIKGKIFNLINAYITELAEGNAIYHNNLIDICFNVLQRDINSYIDSQRIGFISFCEKSNNLHNTEVNNS